jgi:acetolactate synthase-1/2/3 large subunit
VAGLYPTGYAAKADAMPLVGLSPSPTFELVAKACRAWAETVTDAAALPDALARAIAVVDEGRQAVLDVRIT